MLLAVMNSSVVYNIVLEPYYYEVCGDSIICLFIHCSCAGQSTASTVETTSPLRKETKTNSDIGLFG